MLTNKKLLIWFLFLLLFASVENPQAQVTILYSSNINGALSGCGCPSSPYSGLDRIVGHFMSIHDNDPELIYVDSGDFFGTYPDQLRDKIVTDAYQRIPYSIFLPGDQEFFYGPVMIEEMVDNFKGHILRGNLHIDKLLPHVILEVGSKKIAFVGWHGYDCMNELKLNYQFDTEFQMLKKEVMDLHKTTDLLVLVSHSGFEENSKLATLGLKVDIIIGGHTQEKIDTSVNGIRIFQSGVDAEYVGKIDVSFASNAVKIQNEFVKMDSSITMDLKTHEQYLQFRQTRGNK